MMFSTLLLEYSCQKILTKKRLLPFSPLLIMMNHLNKSPNNRSSPIPTPDYNKSQEQRQLSCNTQIIIKMQKNRMKLQLRQETINALNIQYKSDAFTSPMTLSAIVHCAESAMRNNIDAIDYELNGSQLLRYGIKLRPCEENPFTPAEQISIQKLITVCSALMQCTGEGVAGTVNGLLQQLKTFVLEGGRRLNLSARYHKYRLYFKKASFKQIIIFEVLNKCQIFYTILRERKKSGKAFSLDPLLQAFEEIQNQLEVAHPFHQSVLPKKQLRFFQKKITDKKMKNLLFDAVSSRNHKEVRELLAKGASLQQPGIIQRQQMREMFCQHRACQLADLEMCKILHSYRPNWQVREKEGLTPLHYAVQAGHLPLVQFLIQQVGVELQPKDIQNRTPFYFACTQGDLSIIKYLCHRGADINNQSKLGRSALSKACYLGLVDVVNFLLACPGIAITIQDGKGRTALHNSVFGPKGGRQGHKFGTNQKDSPECTQLLLQKGFNVDYIDKQNNTPLHVAMSSDGRDSIRVLLAFGGSLTLRNCYGETPLMTGAKFGHIEAVTLLREQFKASLAVKDIFSKNLMLLCAKFRQDDGKAINQVFYYSTNQLLAHARQLLLQGKGVEKEDNKNADDITDWEFEIDHTFRELLKERKRVGQEFIYFCLKCKENGLRVRDLSLSDLKQLLGGVKTGDQKQQKEIIEYFVAKSDGIELPLQDFRELGKWILRQNNTALIEFTITIEHSILKWAKIKSQEGSPTLVSVFCQILFESISELKEKMITFCLLRLNTDWLHYLDPHYGYNIIHLLVKFKKIGSLIQILKVLSGVNLHFPTNSYLLPLLKQAELSNSHQNSKLRSELKRLLVHRDKQGLDPYSLALLIKDAAGAKLLEQKLGEQSVKQYKFQLEVREYKVKLEEEGEQLQIFNKGYQLQKELQLFVSEIESTQNIKELEQYFAVLKEESAEISKQVDINQFQSVWKHTSQRKLVYMRTIEEIQALNELKQASVIGIDIEYFYAEGHTLISIMQISTLTKDFIIDFLHSAHSHSISHAFTTAVSQLLRPVAHDLRIMKVMHGSDNDLCVIKAMLNLSFLNFLDTARLDLQIGKHQNIRGLATLVQEYLHTHMPKDYQVSEWRVRPIPHSMLQYARRDSMVLPFLARKLLGLVTPQKLAALLAAGCRLARRNRKPNQSLIRSIEAV